VGTPRVGIPRVVGAPRAGAPRDANHLALVGVELRRD
jgi:hypothetical protein